MNNKQNLRKSFSTKLKTKIALEAIKEQETAQAIARKYNISTRLVYKWRKKVEDNITSVFRKETRAEKELTERKKLIESLYQQVGQLTVEAEWLKKNINQ